MGPRIRVNAVGPGPTLRNAAPVGCRFRPPARRHHPEARRRPGRHLRRRALSAGGAGRHRPDDRGGWRPASDLADPRRAGDANEQQPIRHARGIRHVFIRNLELPAHIGVYRQEEGRTQPVRINVDLATDEIADAQDMLENVVDYHVIEKRIRAIIAEGHVRLAETLAERIAAACFEDARVRTVRVRVEKLEALTHAESVGIEIERTR